MSTSSIDGDYIKTIVKLGNDSFKAGYDEGFRAGQIAALAEFKKLVEEANFTLPGEVKL